MTPWSEIELVAFDVDGTLTDGTTWWAGDNVGWVQRYSVHDGEALLRLTQRLHVVPVSRNVLDARACPSCSSIATGSPSPVAPPPPWPTPCRRGRFPRARRRVRPTSS